jgi:hypothetical protein
MWPLLPGLARIATRTLSLDNVERNLYSEFMTRAGDLLPMNPNAWDVLFAMQHHGLPTRLLDWTETLGVAVYFAVWPESDGESAVWILNPFLLNEAVLGHAGLGQPYKLLPANYLEYFIERSAQFPGAALAMSPLRHHPRMLRQRAGFTLHSNMGKPLDEHFPDVVTKVVIPSEARPGALAFLRSAGISEFSLFPDLDGLARELRCHYFVGG